MNPARDRPLVFLQHRSSREPSYDTPLDTVARSHASKQGHLKSARSKGLRFVSYRPGAEGEGLLPLSTANASSKRDGSQGNRRPTRQVGHRYHEHPMLVGSPETPFCRVGSGGWDPFNSLAVFNITLEERYMLSYAFTTTWTAFGESETGQRRFAQSWMWRTMESPATLYAQLLGSSTHYVISCPEATIRNRIITKSLHWKVQALRALRQEVERFQARPNPAVTDSALLAIFVLAVHGNFELAQSPEAHPLSPMATYRDMHIYGMMDFGEEHMNVLYNLIEQRGGLLNIDQQTFGHVMPLLDMLYNARLGRKPRFSCYRELQGSLQGDLWQPDAAARQLLEILGSAFRLEGRTASVLWAIQFDRDTAAVLATIAEITVALDQFCRGGTGAPPTLDVLANNGDWASHKLMSLSSYITSEDGEIIEDQQSGIDRSRYLCETCRLSSLIYLDMVLLPTPPHTKIKYRHAANMLPLILKLEEGGFDQDGCTSEFIIWGIMLGAIASRFSKLQYSYLKLIKTVSGGHSWDETKPLLQRYLWWDSICDLPAKSLWVEAQEIDMPPD